MRMGPKNMRSFVVVFWFKKLSSAREGRAIAIGTLSSLISGL